ncbi:MAG: LpxI family protein [Candidatus Sumerlaeaceae bacterium]
MSTSSQVQLASPAPSTAPKRIGIIAGQGDFPLLLAQAARSNGVEVIVFAIKGFANPDIGKHADQVLPVELGQLNRTIQLMHENGIRAISMAGRVPHTSVLQYRHFDARAMKLLAKSLNRKADSLLNAVAAEFSSEGIEVLDSSLFLKSLMPEPGLLTATRQLTTDEQENVEFGYPIAKVVAGQDIGQTLVVKDRIVVAVEGLEGTDKCIARAGDLAGAGCVVIKVSKPSQDMRFDVPVIGPGTIASMKSAGCTALALSARECLLLHREQILADADAAAIAITAIAPR